MRRTIAIVISIGLFVITVAYFLLTINKDDDAPIAADGLLDVSLWDFEESGPLRLDGKWEFYPDELISPVAGENVFTSYDHIKKIVHVPGSWQDYLSDGETVDGAGTYRLVVHVPTTDRYGVKTNSIRYASKLFLNDDLVGSSGVLAKEASEFEAEATMYTGFSKTKENQVEIDVQVTNYIFPTGR